MDVRRKRGEELRSITSIWTCTWLFSLVLLTAGSVRAQSISVRTVSDDGRRVVLDFTADWSTSLRTAVDSSGLLLWDENALAGFTAGFESFSGNVRLGSTALPRIDVLSSSFDEVQVPVRQGVEASKRILPEVEATGLGIFRKHPVVSVSVPLVTLDPSTSRLRRYRSLRVAITRSTPIATEKTGFRNTLNPHVVVSRSALADGTLFRIRIATEGVYRIDRSLLSSIGLNPDSIDPDNIQILGNGGAPVPAKNSDPRLADLAQNQVFVRGGGDGRFDSGDVVLFYGAGPRGWRFSDGAWEHYVHPFSNDNYYFLKISNDSGSRISEVPFPDFSGPPVFSSTTGRFVLDIEEQVWSKEHGSGYDWMSQTIRSGGTRDILSGLELPGLMSGTLLFKARIAIASNPRATVAMESDGVTLAQKTAPGITLRAAEFPSAVPAVMNFSKSVTAGEQLSLRMRLLNQTNEPEAALDWVRVFFDRALVAADGILRFATQPDVAGPREYRLQGFSGSVFVWDVTNPGSYTSLEARSGNGDVRIQLDTDGGTQPRELIAFTENAAVPVSTDDIEPVPNQNLHGISISPDMAIIAPEVFMDAANRLAEHRRQDGLTIVVTPVDQVYNEFSGGVPDMRAIRDYLKFLYDRSNSAEDLLQYALLFGDGQYDFRGLSGLDQQQPNLIFPYETEESLNTDASFTSDDYFGLLDDNEGEWIYTTFGAVSNERVDIGVGRLPIQTIAQAEMIVDKIIRYESPVSLGSWRSLYVAVADDGPTGLAGTQDDADLHVQNIDQVTELIMNGLYPQINVRKIYAESFDRVFLNGFRIPGAKRAVNSALDQGTLVFNYSGHGGPDGLAQEEIFTTEDAIKLTNRDQPAIFITATCSFGWWDLEDFQSGAEELLLNPNGGSIALLTTVRLVYTSGDLTSLNAGLNRVINEQLFATDIEGKPRRLGDVLRSTKNTRVGLQGNSRKFNLLGDPSMRIGLPVQSVEVETLNSTNLTADEGQMKALDRVDISGSVRRADGSIDNAFSGSVTMTVFDAIRKVPLVKQVRMLTPYYRIREDLIWRGSVGVTDGRFTASFVVPKDISYSDEPGRISAYARTSETDAMGYSENFLVGGTSDNPPNDNTGPELRLFLNDTTFVSGGSVTTNPELIVKLFDDSGINTVGAGVGHELLLVVDGEDPSAQDISSAFVAEENSFQRGEVRWRLLLDDPGAHSLSVRAWDVLNNSNTEEVAFTVTESKVLRLSNVYNYPNPMNRETRFVFEHNQSPGTPARVQIRIYTLNGQLIRTIDAEEALPEGVLTGKMVQIPWNGRDEDFDRIATGIYLYKLRVDVEQPDGEHQVSERVEKIAVIR